MEIKHIIYEKESLDGSGKPLEVCEVREISNGSEYQITGHEFRSYEMVTSGNWPKEHLDKTVVKAEDMDDMYRFTLTNKHTGNETELTLNLTEMAELFAMMKLITKRQNVLSKQFISTQTIEPL